MTKVETIKSQIESLTPAEWEELELWLIAREQQDDDWDRQMKADAAAGKLDKWLAKVDEEIAQGRTKELP